MFHMILPQGLLQCRSAKVSFNSCAYLFLSNKMPDVKQNRGNLFICENNHILFHVTRVNDMVRWTRNRSYDKYVARVEIISKKALFYNFVNKSRFHSKLVTIFLFVWIITFCFTYSVNDIGHKCVIGVDVINKKYFFKMLSKYQISIKISRNLFICTNYHIMCQYNVGSKTWDVQFYFFVEKSRYHSKLGSICLFTWFIIFFVSCTCTCTL